ncbi:MAG: RluA family pseudouridine synthase [Candidatus Xenobia bacterium]
MHPDVHALSLSWIYRDEVLVAVDKPSGMLVHRSVGARDPVVVMTWVRDQTGAYVYPIHRIDRATSGLVLLALTRTAAQRLYASFQKGVIRKRYLAVVRGVVPEQGSIDEPLIKHNGAVQPALTEYRRLAASAHASLLEVTPRQGRRHQIRRHFQAIGHPLLGDATYGDGEGLPRLGLHAAELALPHPITGEPLELRAPLPADLRGPLQQMDLFPF